MQLEKLETNFLGKNLSFYKKIDSTQNEIWRRIENKTIKNGDLIIADIQTNGKGTHGRVWHTDEANNIAFSFFADVNCNIRKLDGITIEIARIIIDIFKKKYNINLDIKEPNDIVYNNKKIGGILTETKIVAENVKYLVVGIGINTSKKQFSQDIRNQATSIKKEFGIDVKAEDFITEFCNKFEPQIIRRMKI